MTGTQFNTSNTVQAFWVALGTLSSILVSIVSAAVLSRYLSVPDLGTYKQVLYIYTSLLVVFSAGLPRVYNYFLPKFSLEQGFSIVKKVTSLLFGLGVIFSLFLFFFANQLANALSNPALVPHIKSFAIVPTLLLPTLGIEGVFTSYFMAKYLPVYNVISKTMIFILIVTPIILLGNEVKFAIYGWVVASIFSLILAIYFLRIPFNGVFNQKSNLSTKALFNYCLPIMGASISGIAIGASDQFFISRYYGVEEFAIFSNGFIQIPIIGMVAGSAASILMPRISSLMEEEDKRTILQLWNSTIIKSALILYPILCLCLLNSKSIVTIIFGSLYEESGYYFLVKTIQGLFSIMVFTPFILASGYSKFHFKIHLVFAILTWGLHWCIVYYFNNPHYIVIGTVFLFCILVFTYIWKLKEIFKVRVSAIIPYKKIGIIFLHGLIISWLTHVTISSFYNGHYVLELLIFSVIYFVALFVTGMLLKINYLLPIEPFINKFRLKLDN